MLATDVLTMHHDVIRGLLRSLADTTTAQSRQRTALLDQLTDELGIHEQLEDEIFYPAMRTVSQRVPLGHAEHRQIDDQLAMVLRTDPAGSRFAEELRVLAAQVHHHADVEEEGRMFPEIRRRVAASELASIGAELTSRLDQLRHSRLVAYRLRAKRAAVRLAGRLWHHGR